MKVSESDLLEKWLSDDSFVDWARSTNPEHTQKWDAYFEQYPEQVEIAETGKFALLNLTSKDSLVDQERSQIALKRLKDSLAKRAYSSKMEPKIVPFYKKWQAVAAILLVGLSFWGYYQNSNTSNEVLFATNFGETQHITLEDQSKVVLNANSTLSYNKSQPRKVWLKGEAFFEVTKKPATGANFQVLTDDLTVEVLGTVFNVKNRQEQTKVFLEEGKVLVEMEKHSGDKIEMAPGELISYSKKQQKIIEKRKANSKENTSWKNGVIRFEDMPLVEILAELSAIYGIQFKIEDGTVADQLLTGGIPTQNKEIMLSTLTEVFSVEITQREGDYIISQVK